MDPPAPVTNQQTEATRAKPGEAADLAAAGHGAAGEGLRRGGPVWGAGHQHQAREAALGSRGGLLSDIQREDESVAWVLLCGRWFLRRNPRRLPREKQSFLGRF